MGLDPQHRRFALVAAALAAAIALAWGVEWWVSSHTPGYTVEVRRGEDVLAVYDLAELQAMPQVTVNALGKTESGPSLQTVLDAAHAGAYESVRVLGPGVRDDGELSLESSEVTPGVLLDVSNRGTVKIVGPAMAWDDRVRDVTDIVVEGGEQ